MPNEEGLAFYDRVLDELEKHGIEPLVTISHYETPLALAERYDGWVSRELIGFYERFVRTLFARYGSRVKYWLTFNEINSVLHEPFLSGGINTPKDQLPRSALYQAAHHELVASALATRIAHEMIPGAKVGCMILSMPTYPLTPNPDDVVAVMEAEHQNLMFGDVHTRGKYPGYAMRFFRENGIELDITDSDREILQNTVDFVSFSYYMSVCETADPARKVAARATSSGRAQPDAGGQPVGLADRPAGPEDRVQPVLGSLGQAAVRRGERAWRPRRAGRGRRRPHCPRRLPHRLHERPPRPAR